MNLSALNSGLSPAINPVSTELNDLGGALSRPSSGTQSGEDFAAFLRHQIASLQSPQRQEIAAQSMPVLPTAPKQAAPTPGMFEQQALRQSFHPGQYLHGKAPISKGMGTLSPGGHYAKQLPSAKPTPDKVNTDHQEPKKLNHSAQVAETNQASAQEATPAHEDEQANNALAKPTALGNKTRLMNAKDMVGQDGQALQSIKLSPEVEIITVAQPATSEKSLTDFALAMGLDPSQIQALLGEAAAANANASPAATTQQMLAMNQLPSSAVFSLPTSGFTALNPLSNSTQVAEGAALPVNTVLAQALPVAPDLNAMAASVNPLSNITQVAESAALPVNTVLAQALPLASDLNAMAASVNPLLASQELPALTPIGMQVQWSSASADLAANKNLVNLQNLSAVAATQATPTTENISTLAVLSMMDADLRPEDIDRLNEEFDKLSAIDDASAIPHEGMASSGVTSNASNGLANASPAQALKNHPDMAQTFEKLSQKLATELASRMNDQLNAGEWKMKFALKPASLGLVDVQLEMRDGQLHAQFDADNGLTQNLIQNGSTRLKEALAELGMNNAYVSVGQDNRQSSQGGSGQSGQRSAASDNRVTLSANGSSEPVSTATPSRHSNSALLDTFV
jgi:flagellar hook-length control protein FliK